MSNKYERFESVYTQGGAFSTQLEVWRDRETGIEYLFAKDGYGAGLTVLLDKDGKPMGACKDDTYALQHTSMLNGKPRTEEE